MKIILTGTHHSGKSSLITEYKNRDDINVMDELVRALATQANFHFTPEKPIQYAFSELALLHFYYGMSKGVDLLENNKPWLFDRCIIDPLYYINYFKTNVKLKKGTLYSQGMKMVTKLIHDGYFENAKLFLLKPIPIVEHDGFRLGEKEQIGVYEIAKSTLNILGLPYEEASVDSVRKHINKVLSSYFSNNKSNNK